MLLDIVKYGNPVLTKRATEVSTFDSELHKLIDDMFETMYAAKGVGLAAPQVGLLKRVFVMDCGRDEGSNKVVLINPVIEVEEGSDLADEGCLSFPGIYVPVERPQRVVVRGLDINGSEIRFDGMDLEARCVSHETEHLDGDLFIEYLSPLKRDLLKRKIKRQIKRGEW